MLKLKQKINTIFIFLIAILGLISIPNSYFKIQEVKTIEITKENFNKKLSNTHINKEHDLFNEIAKDVEEKVEEGFLDGFHLKYHKIEYYQKQYFEYKSTEAGIEYWASLSEENVRFAMDMIARTQVDIIEVIDNLQIPVHTLERNQSLGLYFDGEFLYFLWTSEYLPIETYNLQSITLNDVTYNQQLLTGFCDCMEDDGLFETSFSYAMGPYNLQVNMTPIGGFHKCSIDEKIYKYGLGLDTNIYKITGFTANYDSVLNGLNPGEEDEYFGTEYKIVSYDSKTYKFSQIPSYLQNSMMQLSSHCYIEIKDIECQSLFNINFGGYQHAVFFNTPFSLDDVYRVDVSYSLASDNKPWYNFVAKEGSMDVVKSLTPDYADGGFLGLSSYQGLSKGIYKSNVDNSKVYNYKLLLNYDADGWNIFKGTEDESKYTNVHNFKILRMNFLYKGQEIECEVKMDEIEGETLSIFDENVILNIETPIWQFKETIKDVEEGTTNVLDQIKNFFSNIKENDSKTMIVIYILIGTIISTIIGYFIYKVYKTFKKIISKE